MTHTTPPRLPALDGKGRCIFAGNCQCNCCDPRTGKHCGRHQNNCHKGPDCLAYGR